MCTNRSMICLRCSSLVAWVIGGGRVRSPRDNSADISLRDHAHSRRRGSFRAFKLIPKWNFVFYAHSPTDWRPTRARSLSVNCGALATGRGRRIIFRDFRLGESSVCARVRRKSSARFSCGGFDEGWKFAGISLGLRCVLFIQLETPVSQEGLWADSVGAQARRKWW